MILHRPCVRVACLVILLTLTVSCSLRELSGLTKDGQGRFVAVNNRPGAFALCRQTDNKLDCRRLPFHYPLYSSYDFEGVTWVTENLFYAVIEKRNNHCLSGCSLSQDIIAYRIDEQQQVVAAQCDNVHIGLYEDDVEDCPFANCGLEGIAYVSDRNLLMVAKEGQSPRLFAVQLGEDHCPTGSYVQIKAPEPMASYNGLTYSEKRRSLFILSTAEHRFYEWLIGEKRIGLRSESIAEADRFLRETAQVEGIYVDDEQDRLLLLAEGGEFLSVPLPAQE